jgi:sulfonate transport system substrate-binding protein
VRSLPGAARRLLLLALALVAVAALAACGSSDGGGSATASASGSGSTGAAAAPTKLVVGVPRNFGYLSTLWARNVQPPGVEVEYKYFPVFTDMLTALNAGQIDLTEIGDVGVFQSVSNGGKVAAVAVTQPNPRNAGLIVPKDSPVKTFADLKGRKIIFLRSTNSYTAFLHELKQTGLKESDFKVVEISGPPANKAFQSGKVDAYWTIDPNMADVLQQTGGRLILDGTTAGVDNLYPYVATQSAIAGKSAAIGALVQAVADNIAWIQTHPDEQARLLAPKLGFGEAAIKTTYARGAKALQPIDDAFYAKEDAVQKELLDAGILKSPVDVRTAFLSTFNDKITPQAGAGS